MLQKNDIVELTADKLGFEGEGVCTHAGGIKIFVKNALPGERIRAKILLVKKSFAFAKTEKVLSPSVSRVAPRCPVFFRCGGCNLQHMDYAAQLKLKRQTVAEALKKAGVIEDESAVSECVPSEKEYGYRNKISVPVGSQNGKNIIGFYRENTHDIIDIDSCPLQEDWAAKVMDSVRAYMDMTKTAGYCAAKKTGLIRHIVARESDGAVLVGIVSAKRVLPQHEILINLLKKEFKDFSLVLNHNPSETNVILGEHTEVLYGKNQLTANVSGIKAGISLESFLQVNPPVAGKIYGAVSELAGKTGIVIDAYSGAGILTCLLAKNSKTAYGIEIVPFATEDAVKLAKKEDIQNVMFLTDDCAAELPRLVSRLKKEPAEKDLGITVVLDPPRKGCDQKVLDAVTECRPDKIIYISCNPATLARDLKILLGGNSNPQKECGYSVSLIEPYDMFPQTSHVETLVCLRRKFKEEL